jgi:hypothetical protein
MLFAQDSIFEPICVSAFSLFPVNKPPATPSSLICSPTPAPTADGTPRITSAIARAFSLVSNSTGLPVNSSIDSPPFAISKAKASSGVILLPVVPIT